MLKKILPLVFLLVGLGAGVGAGVFLRPEQLEESAPASAEHQAPDEDHAEPGHDADAPSPELDYVKLNNQFVIPVVKNREVVSLVVLSLSLEVPLGMKDDVFNREPKLRDSFLQVLFDHANIGGFDGAFTDANNLAVIRNALREVGQKDMGKDVVKDVLILEIARQDY